MRVVERCWHFLPAILFRSPDTSDLFDAHVRAARGRAEKWYVQNVHEAIAVHVQQTCATVSTDNPAAPQRIAIERILFDPFECFAEREELHPLSVFFLRVVDELDPL